MIITVTSGKGGTGKTLIAIALAQSIKNVQFLDCDVEEPNAAIFLKPDISENVSIDTFIPEIDSDKCNFCGQCQQICKYNALAVLKSKVLVFPQLCHHCGACTWKCSQKAITEKTVQLGIIQKGAAGQIEFLSGVLDVGQPTAPPLILALKKLINKNKNVILDSSPGVACPVIATLYQSDFVLLVTEPTPFGLYDLKLAVEVCEIFGLKNGLIINRSDGTDDATQQYCEEKSIPILLRIPFERKIAENYSRGISLIETFPEYKKQFRTVFEQISNIGLAEQ